MAQAVAQEKKVSVQIDPNFEHCLPSTADLTTRKGNAGQKAPDTSTIRIPIIFKCGHPNSESFQLEGIRPVIAKLATIANIDDILRLLRKNSTLKERLQNKYGVTVEKYQEIYLTFTENLQRHTCSYVDEIWGKYIAAGYVNAVQNGSVQPDQPCKCGCGYESHGIEVHVYMFLDKNTSDEAGIVSKPELVESLETKVAFLQTLLRGVYNGDDIKIAIEEMEEGAILEDIPYRKYKPDWTQVSDDGDDVGNDKSSKSPGQSNAQDREMEDVDEDSWYESNVEQMSEKDDPNDEDYKED